MDGRPQVRQRNPIHLSQWDLDRRAGWQRFQILDNSLYQIVVFSAPIPPQACEDNAVVMQGGFLVLYGFFSHTFYLLQQSVNEAYKILRNVCQAFFLLHTDRIPDIFIARVKATADISAAR